MKNNKKKQGILFWITGLSGSGKTSIAENVKKKISKNYGPVLTLTGDDLRKIFGYKKFSRNSRMQYALNYSKFCQYITNQNINVILSTVSLFHKVRKWNRTNINNYVDFYSQGYPLGFWAGPHAEEYLVDFQTELGDINIKLLYIPGYNLVFT